MRAHYVPDFASKLYLYFWAWNLAARFPGPVDQEHLAFGLLWQDEQWMGAKQELDNGSLFFG